MMTASAGLVSNGFSPFAVSISRLVVSVELVSVLLFMKGLAYSLG